jgi:malonyl CoA-acyl carrier protein transacylase/NAD(P)-dependent dehydrogenase (short-subunit alcohol dehydrogenase family)/acyl carrier protein
LKPLESRGVFAAIASDSHKLAFCFPGQGTHYISMGRFLYEGNEGFKRVLDQVGDLAKKSFDFDLLGHIFGDENDESITKMLGTLVGAQSALFAIELGMAAVLDQLNIVPDVMIGHSFGEISALTVAGVWDIETAFKVVEARIRAAEQIMSGGGPPMGMMSLICSDYQRDAMLSLVEGKVMLTNINAPGRFVLAGLLDAVKQTVAVAESFGAEARLLPIGAAFHSRFMEPAREPFRQALLKIPCSKPRVPILSTVTGDYIDPEMVSAEFIAGHLSGQFVTRLNLPREISRLYKDGVRNFLEVGPGWSMTKMVSAILEGRQFRTAPTLHPKVGDEETFRRARAFLTALGYLKSAAKRQNLPGMFSPDFVEYLDTNEPAVLALIEEVHSRYLNKMQRSAVRNAAPEIPAAPKSADKPSPRIEKPTVSPEKKPAGKKVNARVWIERVREKLVAVTGYPPEMLEEHLDLEADLGVDSVQRAEIWLALTTEHGLDSEKRPTGVRTIAQLGESFAKLSGEGSGGSAENAPAPAPATKSDNAETQPASDAAVWIERVREKLVAVTGYPPEMLEEHLDLEADLGVDSVQRAEIWLALTTEHGLDSEKRPTGVRTIAQLGESFAKLSKNNSAPLPDEGTSMQAREPAVEAEAGEDGPFLFACSFEPFLKTDFEPFPCRKVLAVIAGEDKSAGLLKTRLGKKDIAVQNLDLENLLCMDAGRAALKIGGCDTLVYLAHNRLRDAGASLSDLRHALGKEIRELFAAFKLLAPGLAEHPSRVIVPISQDGAFGAVSDGRRDLLGSFPAGFVRSIARELPECRFQLMDTGETDWVDAIEKNIDGVYKHSEIGIAETGRVRPTLVRVAGPFDRRFPIEKGDLVLVTGGARGIVFECVLALAKETGCRLLLTGRTLEPEGNPSWLEAMPGDLVSVIREMEIRLVREEGIGLGKAKRIGAQAKAQWELHRNLKRLKQNSIDAEYHVCDVSDAEMFGTFIKEISSREAIRGVVHGAGVQRSKLIGDIEESAVAVTVDTKIGAVLTMFENLDWSNVRFLAGFGSITGLFGNAGQTDYALANDLLGWMISGIQSIHPHVHAQTIDWTAWVGAGMVTEEEAKRFAKTGLIPLHLDRGVRLFLDGTAGCAHQKLAALNASAGFAAGRPVASHLVAARPRALLMDGADGQTADRINFSIERDIYLRQHLVEMAPVVPGTFISEIFFESLKDRRRDLCDIRFRRPILIREKDLDVEIMANGESLMLLPAKHPKLGDKGLLNLSFATCRHAEPGMSKGAKLKFSKKDISALEAAGDGAVGFYSLLDERFSHALKTGPIFRGIRSTTERGGMFLGAVSITDEALWSFAVPGKFVINPVLADMAVQVACALAMKAHDVMAIPFEIGRLHVEGETRDRDAVVICSAVELGVDKTIVDLAVREMDGRLVLSMDNLVLRTISKGKS